jgi:xanthosine phosphorylase
VIEGLEAPRLGIVLGSGLGAIADALAGATRIPYADLPGFPAPSVAGHGGTLHVGRLGGLRVAIFQGRKHVYESGDARGMTEPIRALKRWGGEALLVTNAAGSLDPAVGPGRLMAITDHINLLGVNPLTGPNDDQIGPRFPSMRDAYDPRLRAVLQEAAKARISAGVSKLGPVTPT